MQRDNREVANLDPSAPDRFCKCDGAIYHSQLSKKKKKHENVKTRL